MIILKIAMKILKMKKKHVHPAVRVLFFASAITTALATLSTVLFGKKMMK